MRTYRGQMEIINATEEEIKALKDMALFWMEKNIEFIRAIHENPEQYKHKQLYHELMAGVEVCSAIRKLSEEKKDDGNRPTQS